MAPLTPVAPSLWTGRRGASIRGVVAFESGENTGGYDGYSGICRPLQRPSRGYHPVHGELQAPQLPGRHRSADPRRRQPRRAGFQGGARPGSRDDRGPVPGAGARFVRRRPGQSAPPAQGELHAAGLDLFDNPVQVLTGHPDQVVRFRRHRIRHDAGRRAWPDPVCRGRRRSGGANLHRGARARAGPALARVVLRGGDLRLVHRKGDALPAAQDHLAHG